MNNNEMYEGLELQLWYVPLLTFKEKQYDILKNSIGAGRLTQFVKYRCPCNIAFDEADHKHRYPLITEYETFKRASINGMIFDLTYNTKNNGQYDKLIVYYSGNNKDKSLGYVLFNTQTKKSTHRFLIDDLPDAIPQMLHRDFNLMLNSVIYNHYIAKSKSIKDMMQNKIKLVNLVNITDYHNMIQEYNDRLYIGYPNSES